MIVQIAAIAAVTAAGLLWWRRRSIEKQADALIRVSDGIVFLRKSAGVTPRMVPIARTPERDAELARATAELEAAGFRILGDVEEYKSDGSLAGVMRWFVSADGHVCGWCGMTIGGLAVLLLSEDAGRGFATTIRSTPAPGLTIPDTIRRDDVELNAPLQQAVDIHRQKVSAMMAPIIIRDLQGALACSGRMADHLRAWRSREEPVGLLEKDARNVTGDHYAAVGEYLITLVNLKEGKLE
jgi:hypothetical protein